MGSHTCGQCGKSHTGILVCPHCGSYAGRPSLRAMPHTPPPPLARLSCADCGAPQPCTCCPCPICLSTKPPIEKASEPPKPPPRVQGKVLGYRAWERKGHELRSPGGVWRAEPNRAECKREELYASLNGPRNGAPHQAPDPACMCGFYAWHELPQGWATTDPYADSVMGAVLAWGRMEVHADGFRAEWAEPVVLAYSESMTYANVRAIQAIAGELGLKAVPVEELQAAAMEFGESVPHELRPEPVSYPNLAIRIPRSGGILGASGGRIPMGTMMAPVASAAAWSSRPQPIGRALSPAPAGGHLHVAIGYSRHDTEERDRHRRGMLLWLTVLLVVTAVNVTWFDGLAGWVLSGAGGVCGWFGGGHLGKWLAARQHLP